MPAEDQFTREYIETAIVETTPDYCSEAVHSELGAMEFDTTGVMSNLDAIAKEVADIINEEWTRKVQDMTSDQRAKHPLPRNPVSQFAGQHPSVVVPNMWHENSV